MPKKILIAVNDLFFAAKIRAAAEQLGIPYQFIKQADQIIETARRQRPDLIIFDLQDHRCRPLETIRQMKSDPTLAEIKTIGYLSHVQIDLQEQAMAVGCDQVLPKSAFTQMLPNLLSGRI